MTLIEQYNAIPFENTGELLTFLKSNFKKQTNKELRRLSYTWYLYEMHIFAKIQLGLLDASNITPKALKEN